MKRKQLVSEYFSYLDNKDILLKIFTQEQYDAFINESKKANPQSLKEIKKNGKNEITEKEMTDAPAPIHNIINAIGENEFDKMNNNNDTKKFESLMNNKDTPDTPSETTKIISNKEKEKPMYDKVERKSPLAEHQKQYYKAIASSILEKCIIKLKLDKNNEINNQIKNELLLNTNIENNEKYISLSLNYEKLLTDYKNLEMEIKNNKEINKDNFEKMEKNYQNIIIEKDNKIKALQNNKIIKSNDNNIIENILNNFIINMNNTLKENKISSEVIEILIECI